MAENKETQRVEDFTEVVKELNGLVRENYLNGIYLEHSYPRGSE